MVCESNPRGKGDVNECIYIRKGFSLSQLILREVNYSKSTI